MPPRFRYQVPLNGPRLLVHPRDASSRPTGPLGFLPHTLGDQSDSSDVTGSGEELLKFTTFGSQPDRLIAAVPDIPLSSLQLNRAIVRVANQEWARWNQPRKIRERQRRALLILKAYWRVGVGWRVTNRQLRSRVWQEDHPWSAAFISYVLRMAGAGDQFHYNPLHARYIRTSIENRLQNRDNPFKGYRINEVVPELGDLVGKWRSNPRRPRAQHADYDRIQRRNYITHCDIVTEVNPGQLVTIGGNVSNSVTKTHVTTDTNGYINQSRYFVVIKVQGIASFLIEDPTRRHV